MDIYSDDFQVEAFMGRAPSTYYAEDMRLPVQIQNVQDLFSVNGVVMDPDIRTIYFNGHKFVCSYGRVTRCNEDD